MLTSIHDHHVRQLTVDAEDRAIRIRTAYPTRTGPEFADILFAEVAAYVFRGDALGTILFEIERVDPLALYTAFAAEMQMAHGQNGGHAPWTASESSVAAFLSARDVHGYRVSSSIGMEGAVWAQQLSIRPAESTTSA